MWGPSHKLGGGGGPPGPQRRTAPPATNPRLLVDRPRRDGRLSWPWYTVHTAAAAEIRTRDLANAV